MEWEFFSPSDRELVSRMYNELRKLNIKKTTQFKNGVGNELNREFSWMKYEYK